MTIIGEGAFWNCESLESFIIPDGVQRIKENAFLQCYKLTKIRIPKSVTCIEQEAFFNCSSLTSIILPPNLVSIGDKVFIGCSALSSITIPNSVKDIGKDAFDGGMTIVCCEGSYAQQYCTNNHFTYIFDYQYEAFHGLLPPGIERINSPFLADEEQPYIFISYSHKNRDMIIAIIQSLYESGWKIWYDEGLTIGDNYDETIKAHVQNCSAFLLFVTDESVDSKYIKANEIPWAVEFKKPIIKCILDDETDFGIHNANVVTVTSLSDIESVLNNISALSKGERRVAKGISVVVDPTVRDQETGEGFAYCLYSEKNAVVAQAIILEAKNGGCNLYNAIEDGEDCDKLNRCSCLIALIDKQFLSDAYLTKVLIDHYQAKRDIAICQLENFEACELPDELTGLSKLQWLNYTYGITTDMNTKLFRHLQKRGCRNSAVIPGLEYIKTNEGIVIIRYNGKELNPRIENEYNGMPVVGIGKEAFKKCYQIKEIVIPDRVEFIGNSAFEGCSGLSSVTIPKSVVEIGEKAFWWCSSLCAINLPDNIKIIEKQTFGLCKSLLEITVPERVKEIGEEAFSGCKYLSSVNLPDSLETIRSQAFEQCPLSSLTLPKSIKYIGSFAFSGCEFTEIDLSYGITEINDYALAGCFRLVSLVIPEGVTRIGKGAFADCESLSSITIPDSVIEIGRGAFAGCKSLAVTNNLENVKIIGECAFSGCKELADKNGFVILKEVLQTYEGNDSEVFIPEGVTEIGDHAFLCCDSLVSVYIPDSVKKIGVWAFDSCLNLTRITIPDSISEIGTEAFHYCLNLKKVDISASVKIIGRGAFRDCRELTSVTIPDSITEIKADVFRNCERLSSVSISDSVVRIGFNAFADCKSLTSISMPNSVQTIEELAFQNCANLTSIIIPNGETEIKDDAFVFCTELTIICPYNSGVWKYCKMNDISVEKL